MAFGDYATLQDDFSAGEVPVSTKWGSKLDSDESGVFYESGGLITTNSSSFCSAWYKTTVPGADFEAHAPFSGLAFGRNAYILGRLKDINTSGPDGYGMRVGGEGDGTHVRVYRIDNGTYTGLADSGPIGGIANGDRIGLRCIGTAIEAWYKLAAGSWTLGCSATDSTYAAAGNCGIAFQGAGDAVKFDDFYMGDVPSAFKPIVIIM